MLERVSAGGKKYLLVPWKGVSIEQFFPVLSAPDHFGLQFVKVLKIL